MTFFDREWIFGRTPRELVCILGGLAIITFEVLPPEPIDWPNLAVYVAATLAFAVRFYAARAAAVATCLGAVVQQWPHLRFGEVDWETLGLLPLLAFVLLASSDLVERFERAPSRVRWLPNLWAGFTAAQTRILRWSAYAAGALAGLLDHITEQAVQDAGWARGGMIALTVSLLLLCAGRAVALLLLWATSLVVAVHVVPLVLPAEATLALSGVESFAPAGTPPLPAEIAGADLYILPAAALAGVALALTTPTVVRLLRRTLFG
ncbi:hypothetical protein SAMN02745121_00868 [Nannocystis exedens]|uniref:Uncharacterized protein n=1 Tax=Nannocystis exedens TaxID=54 RepID=A0A1I1U6I9_9BACT|nr:hypothetical protein [Nannocystis exedens]PCC71329.1 hypothetical protein NAEX_04403 [Nannocystis exedens]SFD64333.1 hypothetical protein SAMN02745121_00868 [Nannocystis exedens]